MYILQKKQYSFFGRIEGRLPKDGLNETSKGPYYNDDAQNVCNHAKMDCSGKNFM